MAYIWGDYNKYVSNAYSNSNYNTVIRTYSTQVNSYKLLIRQLPDGTILQERIAETEAYRGEEDEACHAHKGRTKRTELLYRESGLIYVYLCYGCIGCQIW